MTCSALEALRFLLRWPGGCYADHYHWRDGIGPRNRRRIGMSWAASRDDNSLGTHEFIDLAGGSARSLTWRERRPGTAGTVRLG
jgi:alpha-L-arabinofuranosidase